ncbi:adhesion G protein-coupled receptor F5-like isoform X2 [Siphateles boraxobius]|uniref:adhesion G protein-coupled receptor F5-like isoform X2 n=1 Tax=Siphateles boraxobius TaxID=180520 RepID=UPI004062BE1A
MASEGKILKYLLRVLIAILLNHGCFVETSNFSEISMDLQFSYTDEPVHPIRPRRAAPLSEFEYEAEIDVSVFDLSLVNYIRNLARFISLPFTLNNIHITDIDITTVCGLNGAQYECKCEERHVWPNDTCRTYHECDEVVGGTCGCIQALPLEGPLCQKDINECLFSPSVCGPNSTCTNEIGSYNCSCLDGFTATNSDHPITFNNTCRGLTTTPSTTTTRSTTPSSSSTTTTTVTTPSSTTTPSTTTTVTTPSSTTTPSTTTTTVTTPSSTTTPSTTTPSTLTTVTTPSSTTTPSTTTSTTTTVTTPSSTTTTTSTTTTVTTQSSTPATTPSTPLIPTLSTAPLTPTTITMATTVIGMSMTINKTFDTSLTDRYSETYKDLSGKIETAIDTSYSHKLFGYISGTKKVSRFRPGSVIADYTISATSNNLDFTAAHTDIYVSLRAQGINLAEDAFARSEQKDFTTDELYPLQKLDLNCTYPDFAKGPIKWKVNNKDPLDNTRYIISNNNSILTVKNTSESDSGQYSCIIQTNTIPYIQWQNIVIKQRPTIIVGDNSRVISCEDTVQLRCSVDAGYSIEWVLNETVQDSGSDSINYKPRNCKEETFTCRLKGLTQLQKYSYSWSRVTVKTSTERYDCKDKELGLGNSTNEKTGICESGFKGTITYKCDSRNWTRVQDNCVLEVIDTFKSKVKSLLLEEIPEFMANLSSVTAQNIMNITQSPATVQAIVDILFKIADLSQATFINKPVMENFLKTVNIIVSDNVNDTWNKLNKGNTTENTSIRLLDAIEKISDRLKDEFAINETSIQLNRTAIKNSFSITSTLKNSSTEIIIPQVPNVTTITIIIFSTLDNVLPSRNTSNKHDTNNSDVRINGDVVVVKVNETLPKISFVFGITNQSLGNPQCVFWNFSLDAWDSTGCEVKPSVETDKITCECNHTTSFSILMSPSYIKSDVLAYITYIGVAISMASLVICLIIETIVWKSMTRNDTSYMRHVSIVNIAVSLLIANICFIIGAAVAEQEQPTSVGRCSPAVFFMHFFYLALFFWMLISALLLFYRTVMVLSQMSRSTMMAIAFIVGYGAPLLIAVITVASTAGPQNYVTKELACWLNWNESKALLAFVIPALTIIAINLVVLIVVLYKMLRRGVGATTQPDEKHALVVIARCVAILTPIFGLTWGFGIGTMVSRALGIHVVFTILNSLQGFFILVFGTLLDSKVRESLAGKLSLQKLSSSHTNSTSAGSSSTSGNLFKRMQRRNVYNVSEANTSSAVTDSSNGSHAIINT